MILDHNGNEIEQPTPHKFGWFVVPPDCHIKGFDSIKIGGMYDQIPYGKPRDYVRGSNDEHPN